MNLEPENTSYLLKTVFKHLAISIFESPDMSNEFAVLPDNQEQPNIPL